MSLSSVLGVVLGGLSKPRCAVGLMSYFKVPEQGMQRWEVLSRGSAFFVRSPKSQQLKVVSAAHITHPFLFPKFYPQEWLQFVEEKHTRYEVQIKQEETGELLWRMQLPHSGLVDTPNDVVVLDAPSEQLIKQKLVQIGLGVRVFSLSNSPFVLNQGVVFHGHTLASQTSGVIPEDEVDLGDVLVPERSAGFIHSATERMVFADSEKILSVGMCGGPVLSGDECVGILTAKVSANEDGREFTPQQQALRRALEEKAVFMPNETIAALISQSDSNSSSPTDS